MTKPTDNEAFLNFVAAKYGITIEKDRKVADVITPDFLEGNHFAIEAASIYIKGGSLRPGKNGAATVVPLYGREAERTDLKTFLYEKIARSHGPEENWSADMRRGIDAEIAHRADPATIASDKHREFAAAAEDWEFRHPLLSSLGLAPVARKLSELLL